MDLYARALKLQTLMPEFKNSLVLRIGEFHTVLCALRALGGIIENSGIDNSWEESNLYSPATVRQILEGKHLKRALNAHAMTAEVLFDLLVKERSIAEVTAKCAEPLKSMQKSVICYGYDKVAKAKQTVVRAMEEEQFQENLLHLCNDLKAQSPISSFLLDYMAIFQNILSFIRASREGNWLLHLATLEQLCPLFFSQNRLKYAQHVPEYLEKMYHLQETAPEIWAEFYKGSFCVSKSEVGFTSIGVDHALEQKNRKLKVLWGRQSSTAQAGRKHHHDLSVTSAPRQQQKIKQLTAVITATSPLKGKNGELVNIVTKSVMQDSVKVDILGRHEAGEKAYSKCVAGRIIGTVNLLDKMSNVKLQCWKTAFKKVRVNTESRVIELKETDHSLQEWLSEHEVDLIST
eukprot:Seg10594.1 transcript_id=Seg10594.1/GoldUCD/mRNA.D3Y31 product="hypothetical protein" protein_id=Seg10594.1/GoldUCD/D3Y31